jgi:hypothetical protein
MGSVSFGTARLTLNKATARRCRVEMHAMKVRHSRSGRSFNEPRRLRRAAYRVFKRAVAEGDAEAVFAAALELGRVMREEAAAYYVAQMLCSVLVH